MFPADVTATVAAIDDKLRARYGVGLSAGDRHYLMTVLSLGRTTYDRARQERPRLRYQEGRAPKQQSFEERLKVFELALDEQISHGEVYLVQQSGSDESLLVFGTPEGGLSEFVRGICPLWPFC